MTFALLAAPLSRAEHYEVYILAGQSNAGGHGYVSREFSQFSPNGDDGLVELGKTRYLTEQADAIFIHWRGGNPNINRPVLWEARSDGWIPMKAGYSLFAYNSANPSGLGTEFVKHPFGAEVTFAERMREARPGRKVAVIKYSQGGTGLGSAASPGPWDFTTGRNYDISTYTNAGHCYAGLLQLVQSSLQTLSQQGHTHELRGMIWHQGEADSGLSTAVYKDRLKDFIAAIRADLGKPALPFFIGELIQGNYANTRAAQFQAAAATAGAEFISSIALKPDSTVIHFDTTAMLDFGRRYAERMLQFGNAMRRASGHWKLDEATLAWTGSQFGGILDSATGTEGVFFGYSEADQAFLENSVINRPGPGGESDRAYDFAVDSGISGVNTNRPEALPATGDFTLLVWMKTADPHVAQGHLFSNNNGQLGRANLVLINGALQWFHNGGVILTENNSLIFDNQWHQVGVMRKGNQWTLLRDGLAVATGNSAGAINQTVEWMIGRMRAFNGNYEGQIADVVIYNHALDDLMEIQQSSFIPGGECRLAWPAAAASSMASNGPPTCSTGTYFKSSPASGIHKPRTFSRIPVTTDNCSSASARAFSHNKKRTRP